VKESSLPKISNGHNATGKNIPIFYLLQFFFGHLLKGFPDLLRGSVNAKIVRVRVDSFLSEGIKLLYPLLAQYVGFIHWHVSYGAFFKISSEVKVSQLKLYIIILFFVMSQGKVVQGCFASVHLCDEGLIVYDPKSPRWFF